MYFVFHYASLLTLLLEKLEEELTKKDKVSKRKAKSKDYKRKEKVFQLNLLQRLLLFRWSFVVAWED